MRRALVSVENITPFGIWLFVKEKEYFLSYKDYPYFKDQTIGSILNVQLLHGFHLYWSELDVDLEIDSLENPEKYPLKFKAPIATKTKGGTDMSKTELRTCPVCGGKGKVPKQDVSGQWKVCPACQGKGVVRA